MMQMAPEQEIIAVTLLIHQSLTVPPASLNFAIRLSTLCSSRYRSAPGSGSPDIAATVDCLTDITTINHR